MSAEDEHIGDYTLIPEPQGVTSTFQLDETVADALLPPRLVRTRRAEVSLRYALSSEEHDATWPLANLRKLGVVPE
jgi:hypothetical protein